MGNRFIKNCCDGIYNSLDVHFTSSCDNNCKHCVDKVYEGSGIKRPDVDKITKSIFLQAGKYDDVLFLGGEPCLYLDELIECVEKLRKYTDLKIFVTTAVPKICFDNRDKFIHLINLLDGINLSVQHHKEDIADEIRCTKSKYDRQAFYKSLPNKEKIRINLNIVKPYLSTVKDIMECIYHYDDMGFNSIKLSEIQHGAEHFVSFEKLFNVKMGSPYYHGCQKYLSPNLLEGKTPILLKRSCFLCEDTLKASFKDGIKVLYQVFNKPKNNYGVVYEDGNITKGWR